jgi:hypothetical protein
MTAGNEEISVKIGAQIAGLTAGMAEAQTAVTGAVTEMKGSLASLTEVAGAVMAPFLALTALLAGGAIFKDAIGGTIEWTNGVVQLSKRLGITTEEASGLKVALDHLGISSDEYGSIVGKVTRQMRTHSAAFNELGIKTKDANGEWRNSQAIMTDVIDKLSHMKEGTDRNITAMALMGGRVGDTTNLLRLTSDMLAESAKKAERFHLIVGPDGEAKMLAYKSGMADLRLIGESLKVQIGDALLPVLTDLGSWFGEHGPAMTEIFKNAINVIRIVFAGFKGDLQNLSDSLQGFFNQINIASDAMGKSFAAMAHGDFFMAQMAIADGFRDIRNQGMLTAAGIAENVKNMGEEVANILNPAAPGKSKAGKGTDSLDGDDLTGKKDAARQKEWELAQAGYRLEEAQAYDSEDEIIGIKAKAQAKALELFGQYSKEYLAASTDLQNALNKEDRDAAKIGRDVAKAALDERKRDWETLFSGISKGIETSVLGVIQGTQSMAQAMRKLLQSITLEYINMGVKTLIAHKAAELAKTGATAQGTAQRVALEQWAAIKAVAIGAWQAIARIGQYAIEGAAAAFKSIAAIPIVGPFMAPAAAAAAGIVIMGFAGHVASAEGGYDVPRGLNPMTQLHSSEMVLPAALADRIRAMTDGGAGGGSGGDVHFNVTAIDAKGVKQFFDQHGDHIVRVIKGKQRDFHLDS